MQSESEFNNILKPHGEEQCFRKLLPKIQTDRQSFPRQIKKKCLQQDHHELEANRSKSENFFKKVMLELEHALKIYILSNCLISFLVKSIKNRW